MSNSVVIDTNIIIETCKGQEYFFECASVITKLTDGKIKLAVDVDGEILEEYTNELMNNMKYPHAKLLLAFINKERFKNSGQKILVSYFPIKISKLQPLLNIGFHDDDIKFVRIAEQSDFKTIITIDTRSFLDDEYSNWIRDNLDVEPMRPCSFTAFFSGL